LPATASSLPVLSVLGRVAVAFGELVVGTVVTM
jgi:hypothetical protein